jgi:hypothetical protein
MSTNLRCAYLTGSGALQDVATSAAVGETRIRNVHAVGSGEWTIQSTDALGGVSRIRFQCSGTATLELTDFGVRMNGSAVSVVAPASASYISVFYG